MALTRLPWHRVTQKWTLRFLAGRDIGAASSATGDWADPSTRTAAVALGGPLSFTNRYSMLSRGMAPLFAGLGLYCHAPGGVTAPPGVTSLSPSREGLRGVFRRARQEEQGRLRARCCLRDMLASHEDIAPFQHVRTHAGWFTIRPDPCPSCGRIVAHPRWCLSSVVCLGTPRMTHVRSRTASTKPCIRLCLSCAPCTCSVRPDPGTLLPARQKVAVQGAGTGGR